LPVIENETSDLADVPSALADLPFLQTVPMFLPLFELACAGWKWGCSSTRHNIRTIST